VKTDVKEMAKELIALYASRMAASGHAFPVDDSFQKDFDDHFEYEETEDQLECINEIKFDMEKPRPMERLLCGDVGFGKTEVALRAAFKCILDSKQCVLLVPTTILAWQHYQTALKRFEGFPINIEILSRYRKPKQQEQIIKKLKSGEIDFVIGTHRLVQKDIIFKDLGLAIIDEEQRFGVAQKEKFKHLFKGVDILTLSATPIPRTLNMAMSGIRDMSVIAQAPVDRHPVQSYVLEYSDSVIADAIKKELRRGGQVFYLFNNVQKIRECADKIKALVPQANIDIGHGKMNEEELTKVWERLINKETDVLICTTIIETGVDVSNCNTLIVENADNFGLSQLYQLRGRVGRSSRRAFAYFTFSRGKVLSEIATKRLEAIKEFTNFGSGFKIAMRDLQIRGAGNILGAQQHGQMETVGYDMYIKLLTQAIAEEKGEPIPDKTDECLIDIRIGAHIPENYISNLAQRIEVYKKIATIKSEDDVFDVTDELIDRYGEPPNAVKGLIDVSLLRNMAANIGIYEINQKQSVIIFNIKKLNMEKASALAASMKGKVLVNASEKPYISVKADDKTSVIEQIRNVLTMLL
ncbi:MAG: TRCF domain-containing protein, partial [Oscillospiraceae bacterium]